MDFLHRMQGLFDKGLENSRELFSKAKDRAQDASETGVTKFEIMQLERQAEKKIAKLGSEVYRVLVDEDQNTVSKKTPDVRDLLDEITELRDKINERESKLNSLNENQ